MAIDAAVTKRFSELETQVKSLRLQASDGGFQFYIPDQWQQWATSAHHLLRVAFGEESPHYENFAKVYAECKGWENDVGALRGIFFCREGRLRGRVRIQN